MAAAQNIIKYHLPGHFISTQVIVEQNAYFYLLPLAEKPTIPLLRVASTAVGRGAISCYLATFLPKTLENERNRTERGRPLLTRLLNSIGGGGNFEDLIHTH